MGFNSLLSGVLEDDVASKKVDNPFFVITPKTIRFNHGNEVFSIRNITRVTKYKVKENKMPKIAVYGLFILTAVAALVGIKYPIAFVLAIAIGVAAVFGLIQQLKPGKYAFCIKTNSGEMRYLFSKDTNFISDVIQAVADVMENEESHAVYNINMKEGKIEPGQINIGNYVDRSVNNSGSVGGSIKTGDTIDD